MADRKGRGPGGRTGARAADDEMGESLEVYPIPPPIPVHWLRAELATLSERQLVMLIDMTRLDHPNLFRRGWVVCQLARIEVRRRKRQGAA